MPRIITLSHEFVEFIPSELKNGVVYISIQYATASHACACGCGLKVVTPITPMDWKLIFDGETVSLSPSIGNWSFPCRSHYLIVRNRVKWAPRWTKKKIDEGREIDRNLKHEYYEERAGERDRDNRNTDGLDAGAHASPKGTSPRLERSWRG
jgi:hypothetical protein